MSQRTRVIVGVVAVVVLAGLTSVALAAASGTFDDGGSGRRASAGGRATTCTVPGLAGTVVDVTLMNMGSPMMGSPMMGGAMRLVADRTVITHGLTSFVAVNIGSIAHELVVIPMSAQQLVGTRSIGGDGTVDETGAIGEASNSCGEGHGEGIVPGASGWISLDLASGRYELVCNLPGHYAAGMYSQLTVQ